MITTTSFPGRYVQGTDSIQRLGQELSRYGQKGLAICTPFVFEKTWPVLQNHTQKFFQFNAEKFNRECSDEEIDRLASRSEKQKSEVIVGIGGGKTLDTAKAVAYKLKLPVAVVPTIASTDAPCSALAVIYTQTGEFKRYLMLSKNPDLVLVDTKIIVQAPARFLVSGMGDALATWFEAESCKVLKQTHQYFHGEKVAIGTLASLFLTDKPMDVINEVFSFCETVGLPTTLGDIGLSRVK